MIRRQNRLDAGSNAARLLATVCRARQPSIRHLPVVGGHSARAPWRDNTRVLDSRECCAGIGIAWCKLEEDDTDGF
jgi:hypothetical protein